MTTRTTHGLSGAELSEIRDAVPALDLFAIRSLQRAGFQIIRADMAMAEDASAETAPHAETRPHAQDLGWDAQAQGPVSSAA